MTTQKQIMKEVYDAAFILVGAYGISLASKKLLKKDLGGPSTVNSMATFAIAVGISAAGVKALQDKKYLPENPWKE